MGFESFQIELSGGKVNQARAVDLLRAYPNVRLDPNGIPLTGSTYFVMNDGLHVVEIEIKDYSPLRVSCRFMLCHPPSIDVAFLSFVRGLMVALQMDATIRDDVSPVQSGPYSLAQFAEFSAAATRCIAKRRNEWIAQFGTEQLAASSKDVYEKIILPQCQPAASTMR